MMSLYLAFVYSNRPYYDEKRILCMSNICLSSRKNRLEQKVFLRLVLIVLVSTISKYASRKIIKI